MTPQNLWELEKLNAQNNIESKPFLLKCPNGNALICDWIDPWYGMFVPRGEKSFLRVGQLAFSSEDCCEIIK